MTSSSVKRSGSYRKLSSIPPRVQSRCVRSFRVSCFNWCCNAFSSLMAFRSFFSLFSSSRLSFSSFEVSGKGSVLLSRYQHINPVNALGNGIQGGNGVSIVINSKFILCIPPFSLLVWINNGGSQPQPPGSSACTHAGISGIIRCK